jgi:hypothetical protein
MAAALYPVRGDTAALTDVSSIIGCIPLGQPFLFPACGQQIPLELPGASSSDQFVAGLF